MSRLTASCAGFGASVMPLLVAAQIQGPPANPAVDDTLDTIVVTGSYIRRTNSESPSPVTVIDADQIAKSGLNSIADVIRSVSADNSGSLSQAFSGAMAGGADGVALRGLTVDATLVLVDGHRMANYPLADDGQRQFVDIDSLPMAIVDRVEVLKDGASATYGSDAIAGVVNVILKKTFTGVDVSATAGSTDRGDGLSQRFAATFGTGSLDGDGHNFYVSLEGRHQQAIAQEARGSYIAASDLTPWGGPNLYGGVVNGSLPNPLTTYTVPGQVLPVSGGVVQDQTPYNLPGCSAKNIALAVDGGGGCAWDTNAYKKLQPRTAGLDLSTRWTQRLAGGWTNSLAVSYYLSQAEQYRQPNSYDVGTNLVPFAWAGASGASENQFDSTTSRVVLPANSPDNPFNPASPYFAAARSFYNANPGSNFASYVGDPALFFGALTNLPEEHTTYGTDVYRVIDDLTNKIGAWDLSASLGYVRDVTRITYQGFLYVPAFYAALADGYRVGQNAYLNSAAVNDSLVPETHATATSDIAYVSANATRKIFPLPGGEAALAVGAEARVMQEDNPGQPNALAGNILMDGSFYAHGTQSVSAAFLELAAPVLDTLEVDAAGRVDHYDTSAGTAFTPKIGVKWTPIPQLALRGTFAKGFRAPSIAESGTAGSASSVAPAPVDPVRCPVTNAVGDCGGPRQRRCGADHEQRPAEAGNFHQLHLRGHRRTLCAQCGDHRLLQHPARPRNRFGAVFSGKRHPYPGGRGIRPAGFDHRICHALRECLVLGHRRRRRRLENLARPGAVRARHHHAGCDTSHTVPADLRRRDLPLRGHGGTDGAERLNRYAGQPRLADDRLDARSPVIRHHFQLPQRHAGHRSVAGHAGAGSRVPAAERSQSALLRGRVWLRQCLWPVPGERTSAGDGERDQRDQPAAAARHRHLRRQQLRCLVRPGRRDRPVRGSLVSLPLLKPSGDMQ